MLRRFSSLSLPRQLSRRIALILPAPLQLAVFRHQSIDPQMIVEQNDGEHESNPPQQQQQQQQHQQRQQSPSAPAKTTNLTLLQRYLHPAPGKAKPHPLDVLAQVAEEQMLLVHQQQQQQQGLTTLSSLWSVEELQLVTAHAAQRALSAARGVTDDHSDLGAAVRDELLFGASASTSFDDPIGASLLNEHSESSAAAFIAEQEKFDSLHSVLFQHRSGGIPELVQRYLVAFQQHFDDKATTVCNSNEFSCLVSVLQRHILIASLFSRYDAAVEALMVLMEIRDAGIEVARDVKRGEKTAKDSVVDLPVLTWRQVRDVIQACASASSTSVGAVAAATTESNYSSAETLLRLVLKKYAAPTSDASSSSSDAITTTTTSASPATTAESLVNTRVMVALAKCVQNSADLKRFRELMAVECGTGGGGGGGALSHIPVSVALYNELILACSRCNDEPDRVQLVALPLFRAIDDNGLEPDAQTFAAMIAVYAAEGQTTEAFSMFHEAKSKCSPASVAACPALYNELIEAYSTAGKLHDAISTMNVLIEAHAPLTRRGFHAALTCCAVQGDLSQCRSLLSVMQGSGDGGESSSYKIAATPTTLALILASLCVIRQEFTWQEKLTVIGDVSHDAVALMSVSTTSLLKEEQQSGETEATKNSMSNERVGLFCETEGFFCAMLTRVLPTAKCAPIFSVATLKTTKNDQQQQQQQQQQRFLREAGLYRHHINTSIRIVQTHCQLTLCNLLERAVERRIGSSEQDNSDDPLEQQQAEKRRRYAERLLERARAGELFAPQSPTRMTPNAEVAALLPDVVLNPDLLAQEDRGADALSAAMVTRGDPSSEPADPDALLNLLAHIIPSATVFFLPFATIRAIVTEADTVLHLNKHPLLLREVFGRHASLQTSLVGASVETRNLQGEEWRKQQQSGSLSVSNSSSTSNNNSSSNEVGSISAAERESRLDRLADAVLALAAFLQHHGDRVHVESAAAELDGGKCVGLLGLEPECMVQTAAASACSTVLMGGAAQVVLRAAAGVETKKNGSNTSNNKESFHVSSPLRGLMSLAVGHKKNCDVMAQKQQKQTHTNTSLQLSQFVASVVRDPALRDALVPILHVDHHNSSSNRSNEIVPLDESSLLLNCPSLLYLRARANLSLVTCDATMTRRLRKPRQHQQHRGGGGQKGSPMLQHTRLVQKFCRDAAALFDTAAAGSGGGGGGGSASASSRQTQPFRGIAGVRLRSLEAEAGEHVNVAAVENQQQHRQYQKPSGFHLRVLDPTKALV